MDEAAARQRWVPLVRSRGGLPLASIAEAATARPATARFVAVICEDDRFLPALARLSPEQAAAWLLLSAAGDGEALDAPAAAAANRLRSRLAESGRPAYLLKEGRVGGVDPESSLQVRPEQAEAILDALMPGSIGWEEDPDYGWELAIEMPGLGGRDRFLFIPRFLYARTDRVYEYAAQVPRLKRRRREVLERVPGLDPEIAAAA